MTSYYIIFYVIFAYPQISISQEVTKSVTPNTIQASAFEITINGKKLPDSILLTKVATSESKCGLACNKNNLCRSFNFCGSETCELNREDIFSTYKGEDILATDGNCKYFAMTKISTPLCQENRNFSNIRQNCSFSGCQINEKGVDKEWSQWEETSTLDEETEFKVVQGRDIVIDAAHGGLQGQTESERVITWLKFVQDRLNWTEARDNCISMGGNLFSNVDGTETQLRFLLSKMNNQPLWFGIYTENLDTWLSVNGSAIEDKFLLWKKGQPNNYNGKQLHVAIYFSDAKIGLNDISQSASHRSVCDLL